MEAYTLRKERKNERDLNEFPLRELNDQSWKDYNRRNGNNKGNGFLKIAGLVTTIITAGAIAYNVNQNEPAKPQNDTYMPTIENILQDNNLRPDDVSIRDAGYGLDTRIEPDTLYARDNTFFLEGRDKDGNERIIELEHTPVIYGSR